MTLGGLFWVLKAGAIFLGGDQAPLIFEVASVLFALGLIGLYSRVSPHAGPIGVSDMVVAGLAIVAWLAASVVRRSSAMRTNKRFAPTARRCIVTSVVFFSYDNTMF